MVKYILHISDLHVRTYLHHNLYENMFHSLLQQLDLQFENIDREEVRIVITGDLFHQKITISNEQLLIVSTLLRDLTEFGKVIIIPGNHDFLMNNMGRIDSITPIIELLNNEDIIYFRDLGVYDDENIKWVVYSLYQNNEKPEFEKTDDGLYVGLYHGIIDGLSTDTGHQFDDTYSQLNFMGCDLLLCGDIHKRQTFTLPDGGKGVMIGSLIQQNFGEKVKGHGYGIYNVEKNDYQFHDLENKQPFLQYKITDIKDLENGSEELVNFE